MTFSRPPLFLAEITAYVPSLGTTTVLRYASVDFTTKPSETPANTYYDGRIKQAVDIQRTMFSGGTTTGRSTVAIGDLVLENGDGALDDLNGYGFDGRTITIWRTTTFNPSYPADFTKVLTGTMTVPEFSSTEVHLKLRDRQQILVSAPLQTTKFAGTNVLPNGLEGVATDLGGKPKPVCYGAVKNISPPCVNTSKLIYQVHDGANASVDAVYDRGILIAAGAPWIPRTSGFGSTNINAICYGNGLFVIGGDAGKLATSPDGINWTARTSNFGATAIRALTYGNGLYVAVGDTGTLTTSPDGITWTVRTSSFGVSNIAGVAYGNGRYVAVGSVKIVTSVDGITWVLTAAVVDPNHNLAVAFGQGKFVAGGDRRMGYSIDGVTWTIAGTPTAGALSSFVYGRGVWLATFSTGSGVVTATSTDGITWIVSATSSQLFEGATANGAAYGAGEFVIAGGVGTNFPDGQAAYSVDGYRFVPVPPGFVATAANACAFGQLTAAFGGSTFVIVGNAGKLASSTGVTIYANFADLQDDNQAPPQGTYKYYSGPEGTYFRLGSGPAGLVTADVTQGSGPSGRTAAQVYTQVLQRAGLSSSDWSAADITALDIANNAVLGYWTQDAVMCADVADLIAQSVGAWWGVDASGVFRIKQFTAPASPAALIITANDLKRAPERIATNDIGDGIPIWKVTKRWGRYYTVQPTDLAGGVDDASRAAFGQEWRDWTTSDASILTAYTTSRELIDETLLTTAQAAANESDRVLRLRKVKRDRYELAVELNSETNALDIGSVIEFRHSRYAPPAVGGESGAFLRVLDILPNAAEGSLTLNVWGAGLAARNLIADDGSLFITDDGIYLVTSVEN